jgi:hypothetical protein
MPSCSQENRAVLRTLDSVKHPLAQGRKSGLAIHLPLDELELCHMSFDHAVIDPPGETSSHGIFVFLDPSRKGLEFGKMAVFQPPQARCQGALPCACGASGQTAAPGQRPDRLPDSSDGVSAGSPALGHVTFLDDEATGKPPGAGLAEQGPEVSCLKRACARPVADEPGGHARRNRTPGSLALPVRERGRQ